MYLNFDYRIMLSHYVQLYVFNTQLNSGKSLGSKKKKMREEFWVFHTTLSHNI